MESVPLSCSRSRLWTGGGYFWCTLFSESWVRGCVEESVLFGFLLAGSCSLWTRDWLGVLSLLCCVDVDAILWLPVCLCGFCPTDAACRWLPIYFDVLTLLWFRNPVGWVVADVSMGSFLGCMTSFVKYVTRVARISSSVSLQHGVSSFAHFSRFPCAFAATLVAAFVMLAAFAFVHSATACGHSDPAGGSCFRPGGAALLAFSFVFVLLWSTLLDLAGVLNYDVFDGVCALVGAFSCPDGDIGVCCSSGSYTAAVCISSAFLMVPSSLQVLPMF